MNTSPSNSLLSDRERELNKIRKRARKSMESNYKIKVEYDRLREEVISCLKLCQHKLEDKYKKLSDLKIELLELEKQEKKLELEKKQGLSNSNLKIINSNLRMINEQIQNINLERNSLKEEVHALCHKSCEHQIKALSDFNRGIPTEGEKIFKGETNKRLKGEAQKKKYLPLFKKISDSASAAFAARGGNSKIYIGPKNGKFIIKNGSKIYIDRNSLSKNAQYNKKTKFKKR
jgi:uncharacterized protein (DUF342 family)